MIHHNMSFKEYCKIDALNASLLKPYSVSPRYGHYMQNKGFKRSQAMALGTLCHSYILEGQEATTNLINKQFVTEGFPVNEKTGKAYGENTKKWSDWLESLPKYKSVMLPDDLTKVELMYKAICNHKAASDLLSRCQYRETAITWDCTYTGQKMKAMVDAFGSSVALDLKTYGRSMTVNSLEREIYDRQYYLQFAMYNDGLIANGFNTEFHVIFVQNGLENDVCCGPINYTAIEQGRDDYIKAVANLYKAKKSKVKQGQFPEMVTLGIPYWSQEEFQDSSSLPITFGGE